jgi:hypothetical protein
MNEPKDIPSQPIQPSDARRQRDDFFQFLQRQKDNHRFVVSEIFRDEDGGKYPEEFCDDYDESVSDRYGR